MCMEYENNKVIKLLKRYSILPPEKSETTRSIYFYWEDFSFRYSDHGTTSKKIGRYGVIYKDTGFLIRKPGEIRNKFYTENRAACLLRRLIKGLKKERKNYERIISKKTNRRENLILFQQKQRRKEKKQYMKEKFYIDFGEV